MWRSTRSTRLRGGTRAALARDAVDVCSTPSGSEFRRGLRVLKKGGRIVILSTMSGSEARLDLALLMKKRGRIVGSTLRARSRADKAVIVRGSRTKFCRGSPAGHCACRGLGVSRRPRGGSVFSACARTATSARSDRVATRLMYLFAP